MIGGPTSRRADPWSARDPLIALSTNKITSVTRVQADPGIGRGPGGRPTFHVEVDPVPLIKASRLRLVLRMD